MKRTIITILLVVALGGAGYWVWTKSRPAEAAAKSGAPGAGGPGGGPGGRGGPRPVAVEIIQAEMGSIQERLTLTGSLKPKEQVDVTPKLTGRLEMLMVDVGDSVRKGDLIAELEDEELQQQANRAKATVSVSAASQAQREAELRNATAELERARTLQKDGLISAQDVAARETHQQVVQAQVELARAQKAQAEAELRELEIRLSTTNVYAPMTGQIAQRFVDPGTLLSSITPIVRIVNIATLVTEASVPERDVSKIRVGNEAIVKVDAFGNEDFRGRVARVSPVLDPATRSAMIQIEIPNRDNQLRAEMFARVDLTLQSTRQAVLIPREGLVYRGQQPGVYVVDKDQPVFRAVETGLTSGGSVEVLANLAPGTSIVGRGSTMLRQGDKIVDANRRKEPGSTQPEKLGNAEGAGKAPEGAASRGIKPTS